MVQAGQAEVYPKYCPSSFTEYYRAEEEVRQGRVGVWGKSGLQQKPWKWRN
jgi:endonuclease YncB( thermonuclease family)